MDSGRPERAPGLGVRARASLSIAAAARARPSASMRIRAGTGLPGGVAMLLARAPRVLPRVPAATPPSGTRGGMPARSGVAASRTGAGASRPVLGPRSRGAWWRRPVDGAGGASGPRGGAPAGFSTGGHMAPLASRRPDGMRDRGSGHPQADPGPGIEPPGRTGRGRHGWTSGLRSPRPAPRDGDAAEARLGSPGRQPSRRTSAGHPPTPGGRDTGGGRPGWFAARTPRAQPPATPRRVPSLGPSPLMEPMVGARPVEPGGRTNPRARRRARPPAIRPESAPGTGPAGGTAPSRTRPGHGPAGRGGAVQQRSANPGTGTGRPVGTPGATVGRTIALAEAPSGSPRSLGVLAHELSHVADRPETPRLFGESLLDAGERRARRTGASVASFASRSASEALGA